MVDTKHRTTLEIGIDDRALKALQQNIDRTFSDSTIDTFTKSLERTTSALEKLVSQQAKFLQQQESLSRQEKDRDQRARRRERDRRSGGGGRDIQNTAIGTMIGSGAARAIQLLGGAAPTQEGWLGGLMSGGAGLAGAGLGGALSMIPMVGSGLGMIASAGGQALGGIIQSTFGGAQGYYQQYVAQQRARSQAFGQTGIAAPGGDIRGLGTSFGMGPTELPAFLSQVAESTQQRGQGVEDRAALLMRMQNLLGINAGAGGGFEAAAGGAGLGRATGPAEREERTLREVISSGMALGIRDARLAEYLQQMTGTLTELQSRGIEIDPASIANLARSLGGAGTVFGGQSGIRMAQGIAQAVGGGGTQDNIFSGMIESIGRRLSGGGSHMQALEYVENNRTQVATELIRQIYSMGGGQDARAFALQQGFKTLGFDMSATQARGLGGLTPDQLTQLGGAGGPSVFDDVMGGAQEHADRTGVFGTAAYEAGMGYRRAGVGGRVAEGVRTLQTTEMAQIERFLPMAMNFMQPMVEEIGKILSQPTFQDALRVAAGDLLQTTAPNLDETARAAEQGGRAIEQGDQPTTEGAVTGILAGLDPNLIGTLMATGFIHKFSEWIASTPWARHLLGGGIGGIGHGLRAVEDAVGIGTAGDQ